jgi:hypothetical protein
VLLTGDRDFEAAEHYVNAVKVSDFKRFVINSETD